MLRRQYEPDYERWSLHPRSPQRTLSVIPVLSPIRESSEPLRPVPSPEAEESLPDLIVEPERRRKREWVEEDESEEFYDRLTKRMRAYYRRLFNIPKRHKVVTDDNAEDNADSEDIDDWEFEELKQLEPSFIEIDDEQQISHSVHDDDGFGGNNDDGFGGNNDDAYNIIANADDNNETEGQHVADTNNPDMAMVRRGQQGEIQSDTFTEHEANVGNVNVPTSDTSSADETRAEIIVVQALIHDPPKTLMEDSPSDSNDSDTVHHDIRHAVDRTSSVNVLEPFSRNKKELIQEQTKHAKDVLRDITTDILNKSASIASASPLNKSQSASSDNSGVTQKREEAKSLDTTSTATLDVIKEPLSERRSYVFPFKSATKPKVITSYGMLTSEKSADANEDMKREEAKSFVTTSTATLDVIKEPLSERRSYVFPFKSATKPKVITSFGMLTSEKSADANEDIFEENITKRRRLVPYSFETTDASEEIVEEHVTVRQRWVPYSFGTTVTKYMSIKDVDSERSQTSTDVAMTEEEAIDDDINSSSTESNNKGSDESSVTTTQPPLQGPHARRSTIAATPEKRSASVEESAEKLVSSGDDDSKDVGDVVETEDEELEEETDELDHGGNEDGSEEQNEEQIEEEEEKETENESTESTEESTDELSTATEVAEESIRKLSPITEVTEEDSMEDHEERIEEQQVRGVESGREAVEVIQRADFKSFGSPKERFSEPTIRTHSLQPLDVSVSTDIDMDRPTAKEFPITESYNKVQESRKRALSLPFDDNHSSKRVRYEVETDKSQKRDKITQTDFRGINVGVSTESPRRDVRKDEVIKNDFQGQTEEPQFEDLGVQTEEANDHFQINHEYFYANENLKCYFKFQKS